MSFDTEPGSRQDERPGSWVTVPLTGEIDLATGPAMLDAILAGAPSRGGVIVDFAGVEFVGATAIDTLLAARNQLRSRGSDVLVRSPTRLLTVMLDLFELTDLLEPPGHDGV